MDNDILKTVIAIIIVGTIAFLLGYCNSDTKIVKVGPEKITYDTIYIRDDIVVKYDTTFIYKVKIKVVNDTCYLGNDDWQFREVAKFDTLIKSKAKVTVDKDSVFFVPVNLRANLTYDITNTTFDGYFLVDTLKFSFERKEIKEYVEKIVYKDEIPKYVFFLSHTAAALGGYLLAK